MLTYSGQLGMGLTPKKSGVCSALIVSQCLIIFIATLRLLDGSENVPENCMHMIHLLLSIGPCINSSHAAMYTVR